MQTVAVISRKGGAGKSTVAVNLAAALRDGGQRAVLADADPLRSSSEALRAHSLAVVETSASKLFALVTASRRSGCDVLVIDTPASPEADIVAAIKVADICLVVARPTYLDLAAALKTVELLRQLRAPGVIVLNQCPSPRQGREARVVTGAIEALRFAGVPVAGVTLRVRQAYQAALSYGLGVTEWEPTGQAATETRALAEQVLGRLRGEIQALRPANDAARPTALSTV
ncbi:ParA family protein [Phenylobacterium sp.]|uniref:ParA family protein n=1 Tax=Phenylobacterium sp. TaxID=1871053 RepID=UPI0027302B48|nr:ParA family protein [Phenylobacterium sp.]MDP1875258.1 ParA family protein [Phenylobacterium sp.]MDP3489729.1 ParA family protein [Phenylobacterium sp.]